MRVLLAVGCFAVLSGVDACAQVDAESDDERIRNEVLVTGEYPSPAIWRVSKEATGGEHVLWIVGEPPPFGNDFTWSSTQIERLVASSDEVLFDASFDISAGKEFGLFRALTLLPSILAARKNPDGRKLRDVLPADLYARWLVQKKTYLGSDRGIERWRPMFAADELKSEAMKKLAVGDGAASSRVGKLAKERGIKRRFPAIHVKLEPKGMRATIKEFSRQSMNDVDCFAGTVAYVEGLSDRSMSAARAQAWAIGDVDGLRRMAVLPDPDFACQAALTSVDATAKYDLGNMLERLEQLWLDAAAEALEKNRSTVALLPIHELLAPDGRLTKLRSKGYSVAEP